MEENTSKVYVGTGVMTPGAGGSALFVINLCASIAPVQTSGKNLPGLDNYRLYQVARVEDGRTRHRLRLGFFTSESHAESVLTMVRQQYPTAFTTSLCDEDRRFVRGYQPGAPAVAPQAAKPAPVPSPASVVPAAPAAATPAVSTPASRTLSRAEPEVVELSWQPESAPSKSAAPPVAAQAPAAPAPKTSPPSATTSTRMRALSPSAPPPSTAASMRVPALSLAEPAPPKVESKPASATNEPFHVGKGVSVADSGLSLHAEAPQKSAAPVIAAPAARAAGRIEPPAKPKVAAPPARPAASLPAKPVTASTPAASVIKPAARTPALPPATPITPTRAPTRAPIPARPSLQNSGYVLPELDTTQTIRALTSAELNDDDQEKFYAIQLAASEQPVNLDTMPRLDIFEAYRLYSVAIAGSGRITHSLRLGFFKEETSADAVCGYLKTFFGSPTALRVSMAEHARFKDAPQPKAPADGPRGEAKVVELNNARGARPIPTVSEEVPTLLDTGATGTFKANATGSFRPNATGAFKTSATGKHKTLTPKLKPAAKSGGAATKSGPATRNGKTGTTGKHKALQPSKSLSQQLMEEAREVELSQSGIRRLPKNDSLLSRLVDKLTK